jgi:hypothetical protein
VEFDEKITFYLFKYLIIRISFRLARGLIISDIDFKESKYIIPNEAVRDITKREMGDRLIHDIMN